MTKYSFLAKFRFQNARLTNVTSYDGPHGRLIRLVGNTEGDENSRALSVASSGIPWLVRIAMAVLLDLDLYSRT